MGVLNIALEGMMLAAAFTGVVVGAFACMAAGPAAMVLSVIRRDGGNWGGAGSWPG